MREQTFIRQNLNKWEQAETVADNATSESPDVLADTYVDITSDLSFAQTHYPQSRVTVYLNGLSAALHNAIYRNKREPYSRLLTFWTREVPATIYKERRLLLVSLLIFVVSGMIGAISQVIDHDFCRLILGDFYMRMTEDNIASGKPMDVYGSSPQTSMFFEITLNNISVAVRIFVSGILTSIATAIMLFYNGIMIGCFDVYFAQHGLLGECLTATMLHGTLELSAIAVAGAAGLAIGNSWLFPGTYPRLQSLRMGARRGLKIVVSTVPIFVVAGFIESYLTRHTEMPLAVKLAIISLSAAFIIFYYIWLPYHTHHLTLKKNHG